MRSEQSLADTMDINVDMARRAVGSLFNDDEESNEELEEEAMTLPLVSGYDDEPDADMSENEFEDDEDEEWPEDSYIPLRARASALSAKPALAASRTPIRPKRPQAVEDSESASPKARVVKSRYLFLEEEDEDEFATFRQRYKERDKRPKAPPPVQLREPEPEEERPSARRRRPAKIEMDNFEEEAVGAALPAALRWAMIGLTAVLLAMMAFLVYRTTILNRDLDDALAQIDGIPELHARLSSTTIELEAAQETISLLEAQNLYLAGLTQVSASAATDGYEAAASDDSEPAEAADVVDVPSGERIHVVVSGDNLTRISRQFFGNDSPEYIQRIVVANNLSNPDDIAIGDRLVIPQ